MISKDDMISDEELLLYYYRDGLDAAGRARIGAALSEQPELAQRLHRLLARLDAAAATPEVPVPEHIQQRWQAALERAAGRDGARLLPAGRRPFAGFRWQAAAAAVAVLGIVLIMQVVRMQSSPDRTTDGAASTAPGNVAATDEATAYERRLKMHLASTERQLTRFGSAGPDERARLIAAIIEQNRLYALAAERAREPQLARVLRAFSPVLESLARGGEPSASSLARLNFELRVIQARLNAAADKPSGAQPVAL